MYVSGRVKSKGGGGGIRKASRQRAGGGVKTVYTVPGQWLNQPSVKGAQCPEPRDVSWGLAHSGGKGSRM